MQSKKDRELNRLELMVGAIYSATLLSTVKKQLI